MHPHPSPRSAHRRGRATIVAIATAIGCLTFAAAGLAATGRVYVDGNFNVGAGHDFFGGTAPILGGNVGVGYSVFPNLTGGDANTAIGRAALRGDTTGFSNAASGYFALAGNKDGSYDTATGASALRSNTTGSYNVASGSNALIANTTGQDNVATGEEALIANSHGDDNIAVGLFALDDNTTGNSNIAIGSGAGGNLTTGSNNVDVANAGVAGESKAIRIGTSGTQKRTFLAGVSGTTLSGSARPVLVKSNGQLGTASAASARSRAGKPLSATVGHLVATVKRQQRQIRRQGKEIEELRARR